MLDVALLVFGPAMRRAKHTLIVRTRTDVVIGEGPSPFGNPSFRYASLALPLASPHLLCAASDRVFYASAPEFFRIFGGLWQAVHATYANLPTEIDAARLAAKVAAQTAFHDKVKAFPALHDSLRLGCNALGVEAGGHTYAWRKLPRAPANFTASNVPTALPSASSSPSSKPSLPWLKKLPPDWDAVPPDALAFHSEQAFAFHVMGTANASCHACFFQGARGRVKLLVNRSSCTAVPEAASSSTTCAPVRVQVN